MIINNIFNILIEYRRHNYVYSLTNSKRVNECYKIEKYILGYKYRIITEIEFDIYNDYYCKLHKLSKKYARNYDN